MNENAENLSLKCYTCKSTSTDQVIDAFQFFCRAYEYQTIYWTNSTEKIPDKEEHSYWSRPWGVTIPQINETRVIIVSYPFNVGTSNYFWSHIVLPEEWESDVSAESRASTFFVKCQVIKYLEVLEYSACILIKIIEKIGMNDVMSVIPEEPESNEFMWNFYIFENSSMDFYGNWIRIRGDVQGDICEEILIYNNDDKYNVVQFGKSTYHNDWSYLANIRLSENTVRKLFLACE